ncbi:hypothetical protein [Salibacterium sp. K-3]
MTTYRTLQTIAVTVLVLMAIVHFTGIFVIPGLVITFVTTITILGFGGYRFYQLKKEETTKK